jgi:hypothetical protein
MGSSWNQGDREEAHVPGTDTFTPARPTVGLEASELELLRSAPDFDAEEMATVRAPGGWPTPAPPPAAGFKPAGPVWSPPNRVEPPGAWAATGPPAPSEPTLDAGVETVIAAPTTRPSVELSAAPWRPPNQVDLPAAPWAPATRVEPPARTPAADAGSDGSRHRFPEERTVALLAEDLLGRPLDEQPEDTAEDVPVEPAPTWVPARAGGPAPAAAAAARPLGEATVWDQAMPLVSEG